MIIFKMENIILIGDFNGRTGLLNDNQNLKMTPRTSSDHVHSILELSESHLIILEC